jgi:hypothetical protein
VPLEGPIEPGGLANPIDGESMTSDDPSEAETRAAIGPKADLYLRKWQAIPGGGFNWAAFLLSGLWMSYRKMYRAAAILSGIVTSMPAPPPSRSAATPLAFDRYQIRFTTNAETYRKLREAEELLGHAVPDGNMAAITPCPMPPAEKRQCRTSSFGAVPTTPTRPISSSAPAGGRSDEGMRGQTRTAERGITRPGAT